MSLLRLLPFDGIPANLLTRSMLHAGIGDGPTHRNDVRRQGGLQWPLQGHRPRRRLPPVVVQGRRATDSVESTAPSRCCSCARRPALSLGSGMEDRWKSTALVNIGLRTLTGTDSRVRYSTNPEPFSRLGRLACRNNSA